MNSELERIFNIEAICNERCSLPNLAQLLDEEGRPQVIGRATPEASHVDEGRTYVYLLHSLRKCHRVLAVTVCRSEEDKTRGVGLSKETFSRIFAIPQSYQGWFNIAPESSQSITATAMRSIEEVIASDATQFMTCDTLVAYQITAATRKRPFGSDPEPKLQPAEIPSGLVLTVGAVLVDTRDNERSGFCCCSRTNTNSKATSAQLGVTKTETLYLQCFDVAGRHLLLPIYTQGRFYAVAYEESTEDRTREEILSTRCVHQIKDILRDNCLPLVVTLVHGKVPPGEIDSLFIGCRLRLLSRREEKSLVACQIGSGLKPAFVEFPSDCGVLFQMTPIWNTIKTEKVVADALRFCSKNIEAYKTEIQPVINGDKALTEWSDSVIEPGVISSVKSGNRRKSVLIDMTSATLVKTSSRESYVEINEQIQIQRQQSAGNKSILEKNSLLLVDQQILDGAPEMLNEPFRNSALRPMISDTSETDLPSEEELQRSIEFTNQKLQDLNNRQYKQENIQDPILNDDSSDSLAYDNEGYLVPLEDRPDRTSKMIPDEYSLSCEESVDGIQVTLGDSQVDIVTLEEPNKHTSPVFADEEICIKPVTKDPIRKVPFTRMRAVTLRNGYDRKQLDLFLEDSVFELRRNRIAELERAAVAGTESFDKVNINTSTIPRARRRSEPWSNATMTTIAPLEFPLTREKIDVYLEKLFDIDGVYDDGDNSESGVGTSRRSIYHESADWVLSTSKEVNEMPPGELTSWSVEEVAMALRYIGMNVNIISKFSKEQIDGKLLADITNDLLREGFPEMNAWSRQKLVKFIHGWRPKRMSPA